MGRNSWRNLTRPDRKKPFLILALGFVLVGVGGLSAFGPSQPKVVCDVRCQQATLALDSAHPSVANLGVVPGWLINGSDEVQSNLDIKTIIADHPIASSVDLLQPQAVQTLHYGVLQVNFEDGLHTLYLGCLNYGQPDESCQKAALTDTPLTLQQVVTLVGFTSG